MNRTDRISGAFWLLFSVFVSIESSRLGLGTLTQPGPGFLSFWTGIAMGIMAIAVLVRAWTSVAPGELKSPIFGRKNLLKITLVLLSLFLYACFMEALGFIPITLLLFIFLLGMIERKKWVFTVSVSIAVTGISYLLFDLWLKTQLPRGLLGF